MQLLELHAVTGARPGQEAGQICKCFYSCCSSKGLGISCVPCVGDTIITAVPLQTCKK